MSQNAHRLLLWFANDVQRLQLLRMLLELERGDAGNAARMAAPLGVDLSTEWNDDWFNHESPQTGKHHILLRYESGNSHVVPYRALQKLFEAAGLTAAVLETFIDQAGEVVRYHFLAGDWVSPDAMYAAVPAMRALVDKHAPPDADRPDVTQRPPRPTRLQAMIDREKKQAEDAHEFVRMATNLTRTARETGTSMTSMARSFLLMRALGRGVLHAVGATVVAILLFRSRWGLCLGLGVVLLIVLPLSYAAAVLRDFPAPESPAE